MPRIVVKSANGKTIEVLLKPGDNFAGRDDNNELKLDHSSVSRRHARITVEEGLVLVTDLGSTNGTFIGNAQIKEGFLRPGQSLRIGEVEMVLRPDPVPAAVIAGAVVMNPIVAEALEAARQRHAAGNQPKPQSKPPERPKSPAPSATPAKAGVRD